MNKEKSHVNYYFVSVHSHSNGVRDEHTTWSKQQQCHVGSSRLGFCYHSVWQNRTQTGTGLGLGLRPPFFNFQIRSTFVFLRFLQQFYNLKLPTSHCFFHTQGLVNVALDILSRIHTIPTVPIVDCFQKIRQQVKCYLQLAGVMGKNECMQVRWNVTFSPILYFKLENHC